MRNSKLKKDGLNIVPFIDIMLVLLCIVLSISTFIAQGNISVDLPKLKSAQKIKDKIKFLVVVDENNTIYLNDEIINEEVLLLKLDEIDSNTTVVLKSDKNAKFESFIKIIDALKIKKHDNVSIATEIRE